MGIIRKTMSVGTLGVVNYRSGGEKVVREAKKTRKAVSAESAAAAQAHAAEAAAWQAQADAARHQQQLAEARWAEEQSRLDAKPDWYSDPSALQACHHCGAPREVLTGMRLASSVGRRNVSGTSTVPPGPTTSGSCRGSRPEARHRIGDGMEGPFRRSVAASDLRTAADGRTRTPRQARRSGRSQSRPRDRSHLSTRGCQQVRDRRAPTGTRT